MEEQATQSPKEWLRPFLKPITPVFREVVAMSFFVNLLALAVPVFTMQVYNRVVNNNGISTLQGLVVGMFLVIAFDYVLRQARSRILQTVALRVDVSLGRRLFRKIMRLPLQNLELQPSAYWTSLFRDVDVVRNTLSGPSALLVADLPFAILFLILIFVIAAPVAWVLLLMLPIFMLVAWRSANVMADASGQERKSTQSRDSLVGEMIAGRTTIKALALDRSMEPVWEDKHAENIESAIYRGSKTDGYSNLGASLGLITSLLLTTVGALAIIDQNLTIGALIATNMLSGRIVGPLNQLVGTWRSYSGFLQAVERLGNVFIIGSEREQSEVALEKPKGKLTIENVYFAYAEGLAPVVAGITLDIDPGGVHALVGRNGSGKTTLLKIIQGLYQPQKGRVTIDGADIAQFTRSELADWLGYVPQESVLFAGTVRDNITSRMPDASDDEVIKAATDAGVHHFIIDLPDGYATEIGEAGSRLSGGQRQRIAIARALVGDPPLVLLDEPSSSLDRHAETELKQTLVEIAKTRTVIMVSHSPTLLSGCDYLYALDRGKLALAGPAAEVLPRLFGGKPPPKPSGGPGGGKPAPKKPQGGGDKAPMMGIPVPGAHAGVSQGPLQQAGVGAQAGMTAPMPNEGGATPQPKVKAAVTPRGKSPSVAQAKAKAVAAGLATTSPKENAPKKPKAPNSLSPLLQKLTSQSRTDAAKASSGMATKPSAPKRPDAAPAVKAAAMPKLRKPGQVKPLDSIPSKAQQKPQPRVSAAAQLRDKDRPKLKAVAIPREQQPAHAQGIKAAALPKLRGSKPSSTLPSFDETKTPSASTPKPHTTAKTNASLRSTTDNLLKAWAEGGTSVVKSPRKGDKSGRGVGARVRSTPALRNKGSVGE